MQKSVNPDKKCDFCGKRLFSNENGFAICNNCQVCYNLGYRLTQYEESYFEDEYYKQYGKSYIDDRGNIQKKMQARIDMLCKFEPGLAGKKWLEIGSAAGFFLELISGYGANGEGWEISRLMTDFANKRGSKTTQGDFLTLLNKTLSVGKTGLFDFVSAFYVIEHFSGQMEIWTGLEKLVKPGGYLLLAVPSITGPSRTFHRAKWESEHPVDHYIDFSIGGIKKVSSMFNFQLMHTGAEGIHPDRFPLGNWFIFKNIFTFIQKKYGFGDTMFVILKKRK